MELEQKKSNNISNKIGIWVFYQNLELKLFLLPLNLQNFFWPEHRLWLIHIYLHGNLQS